MRWTLLALVFAGCSGSGPPSDPDLAGASTDLAGTIGSTDMATAGGGGGGGTSKLFPLALDNRWTYSVTAVGAGAVCATGMHDQKVVSANLAGGRPAFQLTNWCTGAAGTYDYSEPGGDAVDFYYNATWAPIIDLPLQEAHSWTYFNTSYTWHRESSITVPAGTFSDCWTANQNVSYTAYLTYCRGAGLVRSYSQDLAGNGWNAELASKSF
ncbi:MAG: hypothetical protein JWN44_4081 [Myxococcales bacterium]|nr:hypothetical protein [Myxococcales bacterium]